MAFKNTEVCLRGYIMGEKSRVTVGCLVYLNDSNIERRLDMCQSSLSSLNTLSAQKQSKLVIINNGGPQIVNDLICENVKCDFDLVNLNRNFFDISVHMCSYWHALKMGHDYFAYTYDDFIMYDTNWISDAIKFMDSSNNVACIRLPKYRFGDKSFNTNFTL